MVLVTHIKESSIEDTPPGHHHPVVKPGWVQT